MRAGRFSSSLRRVAVAALTMAVALGLTTSARARQDRLRGRETLPRPDVSESLALVLNIPAFRLDVREDGTIVRSYRVAVGMRRFATPTGDFAISRIIWNPWWHPPDAEWAAKDTITPPGPRNPMGKVKLLLDGPYYLHGTPLVESLGHAASHGCIRMRSEDAADLARLLQRYGGADVSDALMDSVTQSWRPTRTINLAVFVPVTITYELAEVRDSMLMVYPDVYRRAGTAVPQLVMQALVASAIDSADVSPDAVREVIRKAQLEAVSVPVRMVLRRPEQ